MTTTLWNDYFAVVAVDRVVFALVVDKCLTISSFADT